MKNIAILTSLILLSFCHNSFAQTEEQQKMPPMEMLPKNGKSKVIYQLPKECAYQVFDSKGKLYDEGKGEWIDMGKYKKGVYFIKYEGGTDTYEITKPSN